MKNKLINPFEYIAGTKSMAWGLFFITLTSIAGYLSKTHFPDIISVKTNFNFPVGYYLIQSAGNWLIISILFYLIALLFSKSSVRWIDIFGTQAFARFPYIIAGLAGFSGSLQRFGQYILHTQLGQGKEVELTGYDIPVSITLIFLSLGLLVWMVTLMVNAFKVSANIKGGKLAGLFILGFIPGILLSNLFTLYLVKLYN